MWPYLIFYMNREKSREKFYQSGLTIRNKLLNKNEMSSCISNASENFKTVEFFLARCYFIHYIGKKKYIRSVYINV